MVLTSSQPNAYLLLEGVFHGISERGRLRERALGRSLEPDFKRILLFRRCHGTACTIRNTWFQGNSTDFNRILTGIWLKSGLKTARSPPQPTPFTWCRSWRRRNATSQEKKKNNKLENTKTKFSRELFRAGKKKKTMSRDYPGTVPAFFWDFLGILFMCFPFPQKKKGNT